MKHDLHDAGNGWQLCHRCQVVRDPSGHFAGGLLTSAVPHPCADPVKSETSLNSSRRWVEGVIIEEFF
jgi:hypothetical protein